MIKLLRAFVFAALLGASLHVSACETPDTPSFREELARAQNVFVFRLTSLKLADAAPGSRKLSGTIEILRTLKGKGGNFRQVVYSSPWCFGLRLEVGHYYVAATTQHGPVLNFVRGDRSVMDISDDYAQVYPPLREKSKLQWPIANYLKGIPLPASFRDELYTARTAGFEAPPPPPPR